MSIKDNFPSVGPSLSLNFARSKTLDPRITFSRTSVGTHMDGNGLIVTGSADEPRFDHKYENDVVKSLGLLVEESRVTYNTYTEDPTQWNISNMVATGNSVTLPTGEVSTTIEYKGETTDANNKFTRPTVSGSAITAGDTWIYSGFYKKGVTNGERYVFITLQNNTASEGTGRRFDFDTGTWQSSQNLNSVTDVDSGYEEYPNGWYRIWMSCTFPSASGGVQTFTRLNANSTSIPYDTSFSLWGAQLEKASFMTSYIPNDTGSTKTRSADSVSMTGTNFSDWYNTTEGTVFLDCTPVYDNSTNQYRRILSIHNNSGSQTDVIQIIQSEQSNRVSCAVWDGSSFQTGFGEGNTSGTRFKVAFAVKENNMNASYDGNIETDDTTCTLPAMTEMDIGSYNNALNAQTVHINNISYYPKRLTNTQLQNLTK